MSGNAVPKSRIPFIRERKEIKENSMTFQKKDEMYGNLDAGVSTIHIGMNMLTDLWDEKRIRLNDHEIERIVAYIVTTRSILEQLEITLKKFESIK